MSTLFIHPHLGLGDAIVCNALVRDLAMRHTHIVWPVKWSNRQSVAFMWSDVPAVTLLGVTGDLEAGKWAERFARGRTPVLRLGLHSGRLDQQWDRQFYEQAGVPFERRWTGFRLPAAPPLATPILHDYPPFLHEDRTRNYQIDRQRVPTSARPVPRTRTIFELLEWLQEAPEVHVIDSAFLCLADSVETRGRLVFHQYARPGGMAPTLRKAWEVLR